MTDDDATEPQEGTSADESGDFAEMRAAKPWLKLINEAEKTFAEYHDKADNIEKLYADLKSMSASNGEREMKIFWANLEVLKPSIYARPPVPVVTPKFKSRKPLPRAAADVLERCLLASFDMEHVDEPLKGVRDDLAIVGRGVLWLRDDGDEESGVEAVRYEHVERRDFVHSPSRKWSEVEWVAKRSWLSKDKGKKRFPDTWDSVNLKERKDPASDGSDVEKQGEVWELWHKDKGVVVWVSPNQKEDSDVLDIRLPHINLQGFWPCPKPAYGTLEPHTLKPVPDFVYYRDQIKEINELTERISALSDGMKLRGFYAAGNGDLSSAVQAAMKAQQNNAILIPVANMSAMGTASLKDSVVWLPVADVAMTIEKCIALRQQLIQDVYQITGISDIMRGSTDASETLGAQQLKSQYGNVRIRDRQEAMISLALSMTEIAAEIMAENFSAETLKAMSQVDDIPSAEDVQMQIQQIMAQVQQAMSDPQAMAMAQQQPEQAQQLLQQAQGQIEQLQQTITFDAVVGLLKEQKVRPFVLDIETNSTIQPDEQADKQMRTEAMAALGQFMAQALPLVQAQPETGPFVAGTLKWVANGFRMGREMETAIDEFSDKIAEVAKQPKQPSPEMMKMQAEAENAKEELALQERELSIKEQEVQIKGGEVTLKQQDMNRRDTETAINAADKAETHRANAEAVDREDAKDMQEGDRLDQLTEVVSQLAQAVTEMRNAMMGGQ